MANALEEVRNLMPGRGHSNWRQPEPKEQSESIAGAAGPFAISDAPAPTMQDQVADLLDRVRNPRWEYPSWALPKVHLSEGGKPVGRAQKAILSRAQQEEGNWVGISDLPYSETGVDFGRTMSAAQALAKKGLINYKDFGGARGGYKFRLAEER